MPREVRETTAAKAENQVMGAGLDSLAVIDHRVCMLTVRCQRRPDRGIPLVEVIQREYRRAHHQARDHCRTNKCQCRERHPGFGKAKRLSLPIFRDSTSDNAITYDDWRSDVDNYVREGHPTRLIRDSVLCALEGCPHYTTKTAMDDGDGSLHSIMEVLDSVYGGATTYSALMSKLNTVQQGNGELAKDYYERVVQI